MARCENAKDEKDKESNDDPQFIKDLLAVHDKYLAVVSADCSSGGGGGDVSGWGGAACGVGGTEGMHHSPRLVVSWYGDLGLEVVATACLCGIALGLCSNPVVICAALNHPVLHPPLSRKQTLFLTDLTHSTPLFHSDPSAVWVQHAVPEGAEGRLQRPGEPRRRQVQDRRPRRLLLRQVR